MKAYFIFLWGLLVWQLNAQNQEVSFLFMGDIMGHDGQISAAYNAETNTYEYHSVFEKIKPIIEESDFAIANLEVTLAGKPYKGYPQFSSPDALAVACKDSGIDALVTANNHSVDRGKKGIIRTIQVLDSLQIPHTGTFKNATERKQKNLLVLEKNGIRVGILNYTYGTNGIPVPEPVGVNLIHKELIIRDIQEAKKENLDKLLCFMHWGEEYKPLPNAYQKDISQFLFNNGVDIIIGAHPHVVQPSEYNPANEQQKERLIAYSLGNFVSNQRATPKDGGMMIKITLKKDAQQNVSISDKGYYLTWVDKQEKEGKTSFEILPCFIYEKNNFEGLDDKTREKMQRYIKHARDLFAKENKNISEITTQDSPKFSTYYEQKVSLFKSVPDTIEGEIIFVGNSITDGGEWAELLHNPKVINRGISGDTTDGVLNRLEEITQRRPSKIFLMIGVNDLALGKSVDYIFKNIQKITQLIHLKLPQTSVYIQSVLPVNNNFKKFSKHISKSNEIVELNHKLRLWCADEDCVYINLYSDFINPNTTQMNPEYTNDGLHLTGAGYGLWTSKIQSYIN